MTIYLRTAENKTIVDIELSPAGNNKKSDISVAINIAEYSLFLLNTQHGSPRDDIRNSEVIADFMQIAELRGWFWEVYMQNINDDAPTFNEAFNAVIEKLRPMADKYQLEIMTD